MRSSVIGTPGETPTFAVITGVGSWADGPMADDSTGSGFIAGESVGAVFVPDVVVSTGIEAEAMGSEMGGRTADSAALEGGCAMSRVASC